jgi:two-component system chemotaxis response regulator CheY
MPKKDGLTVVREIIAQNFTDTIILITASDDHKVIQQCLDSGAVLLSQNHFTLTMS